ncbi:ABC transporter permease [soil metagenome]
MTTQEGGVPPRGLRVLLSVPGLRTATRGIAAAAIAVILWILLYTFGGLSETAFPPLTSVVGALVGALFSAELWAAVGATLFGALTGLVLSIIIAVPLGLAIGLNSRAHRATSLVIEFLRTIPPPALIPIVVLVLGSGMQTKITLVVVGCLFSILYQVVYGTREIDSVARDTAKVFEIRRFRYIWSIALPFTLPYMFTGLRLAVSVALLLSVAVEILLSSGGLGQRINDLATAQKSAEMYATIIVVGAIGMTMNSLLLMLQRRVLDWTPSSRV